MTNGEKYKDELIKNFIMDGDCGLRDVYDEVIKGKKGKRCLDDDGVSCDECRKTVVNWMFEEENND